jgi:hypothetical protein
VRVHATDGPQGRRLAGAVAAEHAQDTTLGDLEAEPVDGKDVAVPDGHLVELDTCHDPNRT